MSLSSVSQLNLKEEKKIQSLIFQTIEDNESMVFSSGAGSGKTYSLIESLKYTVNNFSNQLQNHHQKIICITYTNVAAQEVAERLGNTDIIMISTIHERLWQLIKNYQKELLNIHKDKLAEEIAEIQRMLSGEKKYKVFRDLNENQYNNFKKIMIDNKKLFYDVYNYNASDFKKAFEDKLNSCPPLLKNVDTFKSYATKLYKIDAYTTCYKKIEAKDEKYNQVRYNALYNRDQLNNMRISHDTLLEYSLKIIEKYNVLKQIIIDKYPYIFIDEYQDTNEKVIKIMYILQLYAQNINHPFYVGYFGDPAQNIYTTGIGKELVHAHPNLKEINKKFNRRSTKEIIDTINIIRNDDIEQNSIYEDCQGGTVHFYVGSKSDTKDFIAKHVNDWEISEMNKLHCLVLTNETVATFTGFPNVYKGFKSSKRYSGYNFNQLNTELLSKDLSNLGEVPNLLFNIINFKNNIENKNTPLINIINKDIYKDMNFLEIKKLIESLQKINTNTLEEYLEALFNMPQNEAQEAYNKLLENLFETSNLTLSNFKSYLLSRLFPDLKETESVGANKITEDLLRIDLSEYDAWYEFLIGENNSPINYHTYHGTKGLEFDNVIIIMENAFGRESKFFNYFFENFKNPDDSGNIKKYEAIKNLLYVSSSRAIKNLAIFYTDDITEFKSNIESIFGKVQTF